MSLADAARASDALDALDGLESSVDSSAELDLGPVPLHDAPPAPRRARKSGHTPSPTPSHGASHAAKPRGGRASVSAGEIAKPLEGSLGLLTFGLALLLCGFSLEDPAVDVITMDAEEAEAIAVPLANILVRQKWFSQYGGALASSQDAIALAFAALMYCGRVAPAVKAKLAPKEGTNRAGQHQATRLPAQEPEPVGFNGYIPGGAYAVN